MGFFLTDLSGLMLGVLLGFGLILLPGFGIVRLLERTGLHAGNGWPRVAWALILAFALLPAIDALLVRGAGLPAMGYAPVQGRPFRKCHRDVWLR